MYGLFFRKDGFPGADGSTIEPISGNNASTTAIYDANGDLLTEGNNGVIAVEITTSGVLGDDNTSLTYATKQPLTYIYNSASLGDWYTNNQTYINDVLWNEGNKKSAYDPCPKKWKMPADIFTTYGDFSDTTFPISGSSNTTYAGRTYQSIAWFPAAGYRNYVSGDLRYVGCYASYWSASVSGTDTKNLYFTMSGVYPRHLYYRACGSSVRCVQE